MLISLLEGDMEDLVLLESNSVEENILAIIEFIKQVEREHGLSEDEIVYKYTCGACKHHIKTGVLTINI